MNLAVTLTASGASSFLNGYEAVTTTATTGVVLHIMGEGAESAAFNTQNANALGVMKLIAAQTGRRAGLCIGSGGENDAQNPSVVTPQQFVAQWQTVATTCASLGASFSFAIPTPYNSTTLNQYGFIQLAIWQWAMRQQGGVTGPTWDLTDMGSAWASAGVQSSSLVGGPPNYLARNLAAAIAYDVAVGLLQPADSQHPTDYGSCLITAALVGHYVPGSAFTSYTCNWEAQQIANHVIALSAANYTNATTSFTALADTSSTIQWTVYGAQIAHIHCHLRFSMLAAGALSITLAGTGTPVYLNQDFSAYTGASAVTTITSQTAAFSTALTLGVSQTITTVFDGDYYADFQYTATPNATSTVSVQMHPSASTLTVYRGSQCSFVSP